MSLSDYLAKNYLGGSEKKKEKRKHEKNADNTTLVIDDHSFPVPRIKKSKTVKKLDPAHNKSVKTNDQSTGSKGWKIVGTNETVKVPKVDDEGPKMSSGAKAGLQTAEQVAQQIREKEEEHKRQLADLEQNNETVFRDGSGRKIDMNKIRDHERLKNKINKLKEEERKKELNMGLVQKLQLEKSKHDLKNIQNSSLARYADDKELNEKLRKKELDDDPLLSFNPTKSKKYISLTGRKLYRGGFPENRFGIAPGHRWDGVDRSNGFESKWFKKQADREREKTLAYSMEEEY